jgi:hypothetical protein
MTEVDYDKLKCMLEVLRQQMRKKQKNYTFNGGRKKPFKMLLQHLCIQIPKMNFDLNLIQKKLNQNESRT